MRWRLSLLEVRQVLEVVVRRLARRQLVDPVDLVVVLLDRLGMGPGLLVLVVVRHLDPLGVARRADSLLQKLVRCTLIMLRFRGIHTWGH